MLILQVQGIDHAAQVFENTAKGTWKRGLMVYVGQLVRQQTQRRISSEKTAPSGASWAAWAPSTAARRGVGHSLLVFTGKLLGSIYSKATADSAEVGTGVPYGGFIQDGTDRMVAREFLGLSSSNESELMAAVNKFVQSSLLP